MVSTVRRALIVRENTPLKRSLISADEVAATLNVGVKSSARLRFRSMFPHSGT